MARTWLCTILKIEKKVYHMGVPLKIDEKNHEWYNIR
jgi:hypothetical protein